jgi:hypothetical protein
LWDSVVDDTQLYTTNYHTSLSCFIPLYHLTNTKCTYCYCVCNVHCTVGSWYRAQELLSGRTQRSLTTRGSLCCGGDEVRVVLELVRSWLVCTCFVRDCQRVLAESSGAPNRWFEELPSCGACPHTLIGSRICNMHSKFHLKKSSWDGIQPWAIRFIIHIWIKLFTSTRKIIDERYSCSQCVYVCMCSILFICESEFVL